jgi:hypothetical protein
MEILETKVMLVKTAKTVTMATMAVMLWPPLAHYPSPLLAHPSMVTVSVLD